MLICLPSCETWSVQTPDDLRIVCLVDIKNWKCSSPITYESSNISALLRVRDQTSSNDAIRAESTSVWAHSRTYYRWLLEYCRVPASFITETKSHLALVQLWAAANLSISKRKQAARRSVFRSFRVTHIRMQGRLCADPAVPPLTPARRASEQERLRF